jgi:hypothetical protein
MNDLERSLDAALRRLAAMELLVAFPGASSKPVTAEQLAESMELVAVQIEPTGKVRLVFDARELYYRNTVSVVIGASGPEIDG